MYNFGDLVPKCITRYWGRHYLFGSEGTQVTLQVSSRHQLHDDQRGLTLGDHTQETNLQQIQHIPIRTENPTTTTPGNCQTILHKNKSRSSWMSLFVSSRTTWWQLNSFMTEASLRNSILSLMLADSLTVLMATRVSGSSLTTPLATPSYTMPNEPCPSSRLREIFSRATSHSSGTYTIQKIKNKQTLKMCAYIYKTLQVLILKNHNILTHSLRHWSILG